MEKVNYTITLDDCSDYVKYQLKIKRIRTFVMKSFIPFWIIGLIFAIITLLPLFSIPPFPDVTIINNILYYLSSACIMLWPIIGIWLVIFGIALGIYLLDPFHALSKRVYKMLQGGALDIELEVKEDGLYAEGKGVSSVLKWDGIIDIYDTGKTFLVFVSDYRAVIIPKRAFGTDNNAQEFLKYTQEKIANSKS